MLYEVFSIHDEKATAFLPPFILPNNAMAQRIFSDCINSEDHQFAKHPADYTLFRLGQFNDMDGTFILKDTKQSLGNGVEFRRMDSNPATEGRSNGKESSHEGEPPVSDGSSVLTGPASEDSSQ